MRKTVGQWLGTLFLILGSMLIATAALGTVAISPFSIPVSQAPAAASPAEPAAIESETAGAVMPGLSATPGAPGPSRQASPLATPTATATGPLRAVAGATPTPTPTALPDLASTAQAEASPTTTTSAAAMPAAAAHTPGAPTRLSIPALGLDAPIVEVPLQDGTWDMQALTFEIAHLGHTAYPGQGSNVVLAGHVTIVGGIGPFYRLEQLSDGAEITVYAGEQAFVYTVASRERLLPTDVEIVQPGGREQLTLITCTTWDAANRRYLERIALICFPAETPPA